MHDRAAALRTVALWLAIGVLGGAFFLWRMRTVDPDRSVHWRAESDVAVQARALLRTRGFTAPAESARVELVRETALLDSLQQRMGRPGLLDTLRSSERARFPVYVWHVTWDSGNRRLDEGVLNSVTHAVELDDEGHLLGLRVATIRPEDLAPDPGARALLHLDAPAQAQERGPEAAPEALLPRPPPNRPALDSARLRLFAQPPLHEADARALAGYHLKQTPYAALSFVVDSVAAAQRPGLEAARVTLHSTATDQPRRFATVEVASTGALLGLSVRDDPPRASGPSRMYDTALQSARAALLFCVLIAIAIGFVRRLARRQVDVQGSLRDALGTAVLGSLFWLIASAPSIQRQVPSFGLALFVIAVNCILVGAGVGFAGMAASGVATSMAQPRWPEKLYALMLLRRGALHDGRVGQAFLRGTCAALAALGFLAIALEAFPTIALHVTTDDASFMHAFVLSPIGFGVTWPLLVGYLAVTGVLVPALALGERTLGRRILFYGGAVLLLGLFGGFFNSLPLVPRLVVATGIAGLAFAMLRRYDVLTALTVYFVVGLLWTTREGWLTLASPAYTDSLIAFAVVGVLLLIGAAGSVASIETATEQGLVPAYLVEHAKEARVRKELEIAHTVQRSFLPATMPAMPGVEIAATCVPASEVGGDLYDFVVLSPTRVAVAIGDVSGKGIQAAFVMTLVKGFLQTLARDTSLAPCDVLSRLNGLFRANVPRGAFITMIYGVLDMETRTFTYARAGHCPLVRLRKGSEPQMLRPAGAAIGLARDDLFHASIHEQTLRLADGDTLVLFTDGFSEAMDPHHELYGDERLLEAAGRTRPPSSSALIDALVADVQSFANGAEQHDDMTMVVVRIP